MMLLFFLTRVKSEKKTNNFMTNHCTHPAPGVAESHLIGGQLDSATHHIEWYCIKLRTCFIPPVHNFISGNLLFAFKF